MSPGYEMVPGGQGHIRASTAERERAVDVLKAAFAEGRLEHDEYAERVGYAHRARTHADLAILLADLPVGPFGPGGPIVMISPDAVPIFRLAPPRSRASGTALAALVLGIGAFPTMGATAIPAIGLGLGALVGIVRKRDRSIAIAPTIVIATAGAIAGGLALPLLVTLIGLLLRNGGSG